MNDFLWVMSIINALALNWLTKNTNSRLIRLSCFECQIFLMSDADVLFKGIYIRLELDQMSLRVHCQSLNLN